jgi:hypothetical protein
LVTTLRAAPVALFVTVAVAPDTAAPDESVTKPVISPLVCAETLAADSRNSAKVKERIRCRLFRILVSEYTWLVGS